MIKQASSEGSMRDQDENVKQRLAQLTKEGVKSVEVWGIGMGNGISPDNVGLPRYQSSHPKVGAGFLRRVARLALRAHAPLSSLAWARS